MIVVQEIITVWTKDLRGGDLARQRNAVPNALPFPDRPGVLARGTARVATKRNNDRPTKETGFVVHEVGYGEADHFVQPWEALAETGGLGALDLGSVLVEFDGEQAIVTYLRTSAGVPHGSPYPKEFSLGTGDWLQLIYNGRYGADIHGEFSTWKYQKTTVNIALVKSVDPGIFTRSKPTHQHLDLHQLF